MSSDIRIARAATKAPIAQIAARLGLGPDQILPYGHDKAKITHEALAGLTGPEGRLILVTAINPTPAGDSGAIRTASAQEARAPASSRASAATLPASGPKPATRRPTSGGPARAIRTCRRPTTT